MRKGMERLWVSWLNSAAWRTLTEKGPADRFLRSDLFRRADRRRQYVLTALRSRRQPALFDDVRAFCMFVGHVKSGSTLIGSLLDAHPDAIIADEVSVPGYVESGFSKEQIFHLLLKTSQRDQMKGRVTARRLTPYAVAVPGQWQGRFRTLRVIGHSQAGPVTGRLLRKPALVDEIAAVMGAGAGADRAMRGVDLKVIHVIRNPFDPISLMMVRGRRSFANAVDHYFAYCETLQALYDSFEARAVLHETLIPVRYEAFIREPEAHLRRLCAFLGLEVGDAYLRDCARILHAEPERSRDAVAWTEGWIETVEEKMQPFAFLQGYTFGDGMNTGAPYRGAAQVVR